MLFMNPNTAVCTTNHVKYIERVFFSISGLHFFVFICVFRGKCQEQELARNRKIERIGRIVRGVQPYNRPLARLATLVTIRIGLLIF